MSLIVSGLVVEASAVGEAASGDAAVVVLFGERFWRRVRMAERTGIVSIESGERPSGRLEEGGCGVDREGEVMFAMIIKPLSANSAKGR